MPTELEAAWDALFDAAADRNCDDECLRRHQDEVEAAVVRPLHDEIPDSFYAGGDLRQRIYNLVSIWRRSVEATNELEARRNRLEEALRIIHDSAAISAADFDARWGDHEWYELAPDSIARLVLTE